MWKCWSGPMSPASRNVKAEAMAAAHKQRVEAEVNAYLLSESRKTEARIATAEVKNLCHFFDVCGMCVFTLNELLMVCDLQVENCLLVC